MDDARVAECAKAIRQARGLLITAGAGMGVDSGLPDFRGDTGFWKAYPLYARLGLSFVDAANPAHFRRDPAFGWGFYGHRCNLYRDTMPHEGFQILRRWIDRYALTSFVVTSNVDGQFQKAGFADDAILEVHGSIHHLQCLEPCSPAIWPNRAELTVDSATMRASSWPRCLSCNGVARPNILMFGDFSWLGERTEAQHDRFQQFLCQAAEEPLVVVELGAGTAIPTIRHISEQVGRSRHGLLVRINPREAQGPAGTLSMPIGAMAGLAAIDRHLEFL
jgi:NAD-dependent SIR2 family protein deacetylase